MVAALATDAACGQPSREAPPAVVAPVDVTRAPPESPQPTSSTTPAAPTAPTAPTASVPSTACPGGGIWAADFAPGTSPQSCAQLRCPRAPLPYPAQERFDFLKGECRALEAALRPEVFQRFLGCVLARHSSDCDARAVNTSECLACWSNPPDLDPASEAKCRPLLAACSGAKRSPDARGTLTMEACRGILSVASVRAERKMSECITTFCGEAAKYCYNAVLP
jgi:hypothetical protein